LGNKAGLLENKAGLLIRNGQKKTLFACKEKQKTAKKQVKNWPENALKSGVFKMVHFINH